jgi:DNA-binding NarL/FixJ family response regulator
VDIDVGALVERGEAALAAGRWADAAECYREVLQTQDRPDAHYGLATALWWLGDVRDSLRAWNATYSAFCDAGASAEAAQCAINLAIFYASLIGNHSVASGWLRRASRRAGELDDAVTTAWVQWASAALETDRAAAYSLAEHTRSVAIDHGDRDLEVCSLSVAGWALVGLGRTEEGVLLLDEAMAAAIGGECSMLDSVIFTSCRLMEACRDCADFERILHWVRAVDDFVASYGCPFLNATCRTHYGEVLAAVGDWTRADAELQHAIRLAAHSMPEVQAMAAACLAELRVAQGRLDEARALLAGFEGRGAASVAVARLALATGELETARATVERQLARLDGSPVQAAQLREVLGEVHLARGDLDGAREIADELAKQGHQLGCQIIVCRASRLAGRVHAASEEADEARHLLEGALAGFAELGLTADVARTRQALALLLAGDHPELAVAEARLAHATFHALGARPEAESVRRWLSARGAEDVSALERTPFAALTRREAEVLDLIGEALSNPEIAERLFISRRTAEHHVASILSKLGLRNRTEAAAAAAGWAAHR